MKRVVLIASVILTVVGSVSAKNYVGSYGINQTNYGNSSGKTGVFDCSPSTSQVDLDINNVRVRLLAGGDFWWDGVEKAKYEIPKVDPSSGATSISSIYSGALWFTGLDNGGNLQCASQTYRSAGRHDFYTGPLYGNFGQTSFDKCSTYDKHFVVYKSEIDAVRTAFTLGGGNLLPADVVPENVLKWPGKGNPYYLDNDQEKYYNEGSLAPFFDYNGDGIYNPRLGDYPSIGIDCGTGQNSNYADQMIFWVINDNGQVHGRTGGVPIGIQINCLAFAYSTADALNDMTFYSFEVVKKSPNPLFETYMGIFVDPDLGTATDDYIGCDTARSIGYVYNANATDLQYGTNIPISAIDFFEGPLDDNGNQLGLSSFFYFNNALSGCQTDPDVASEFRNFQTGKDKCGNNWTFGGNGIPGSPCNTGVPTNFVYPGNPADPNAWSEVKPGPGCGSIAPNDRRFVQNSGPFTLQPGAKQRITIGVVTVFPDNYTGVPDIEQEVGAADDLAQNLFDNCFDIIDGPDAPTLSIRELKNKLIINLENLPGSNNYGEAYEQNHALPNNGVANNDSSYRFQGYMVYQLINDQVTAQDLDDPSKAKLVLQCDLKDGISDMYNYVKNGVGTYNAELKVSGKNVGISRSVVVTEDAFATGEKALVNNKKYYFAAIAYASTNYVVYPALPSYPDLEIFKQGRGNFVKYSAIPHDIATRNGGTVLQAASGDPLSVYRLEGQGNAGVPIRLSDNTVNEILSSSNSFADVLEYELGYDPIQAKVVDPLNLKNVSFEVRFEAFDKDVFTNVNGEDSVVFTPNVQFSDSNSWKVFVYNSNGTPIDTITAERPFDREYEQLLRDYGVSIKIDLINNITTNLRDNSKVYKPMGASLEFNDVTAPWLNFIGDAGFATPTNWIRGGDGVSTDLPQIFDANQYDELGGAANQMFYDMLSPDGTPVFQASLLDGKIAPYCLTANYANPGVTIVEGRSEFSYGPAFRWDKWDVSGTATVYNPRNTLNRLASVSIVLTADQTKWSDCIVFETGENPAATVGNALKGGLRNTDIGNGVGRAKFPGYAINLETGERLNIAFGEASDAQFYNGADMIWNPTSDIEAVNTSIPGIDANVPIWGGRQHVYVFSTKYDNGQGAYDVLSANPIPSAANASVPTAVANLYDSIMYTFIPIVDEKYVFVNPSDIPTDAKIYININKPLQSLQTSETFTANGNSTLPRYKFNTLGLEPIENDAATAESALDNIRVVPNPYYAFSAYEESQLETVVKIVGLPDKCEVSIFSLDGKLVRKYNRAVGSASTTLTNRQEVSSGQPIDSGVNLDNSISWDLNNDQRIPIGSGIYIIHVNAFDLGEKVVKAAIFMRPTDVSNF